MKPPRPDTSLEKLSRLHTVYQDGVCTAGNSSTENDGAAAVVLMRNARLKNLASRPWPGLISSAVAASDPTLTYPAVPVSVNKALDRVDLNIDHMEVIEIQEAFAVQMLADAKLMGLSGIRV